MIINVITCLPLGIKNTLKAHASAVSDAKKKSLLAFQALLFPIGVALT